MVFDSFSREKWIMHCQLYQKNKIGLGFQARFSMDEDGKGTIFLKGLDQKYKKVISDLSLSIVRGLIIVLNDLIPSVQYARLEDREAQAECHIKEYREQLSKYANILLEEGMEKALDVFSIKQELIQLEYETKHMRYEDGNWILPGGDTYQGGALIDHNTGQPYYTMMTSVWKLILGTDKKETTEMKEGRA